MMGDLKQMYKIQRDRYKSARGGYSRLLDLTCAHCQVHVAYYQKDGPGRLKRLYFDRIIDHLHDTDELRCPSCARVIGLKIVYEPERRLAYRLFVGALEKRIVKRESVNV